MIQHRNSVVESPGTSSSSSKLLLYVRSYEYKVAYDQEDNDIFNFISENY